MAKNDKFTRMETQDNFVTEKIDVIQNNLLGDYDDQGNYFIAPQIINELLQLNKVKRTSFANSVFCVGNLLGYGELVFELVFDSKTQGGKSASATLYLLEDVDKINGYLQNTLKTKLDDYSNNVAQNFIEETYKNFNISISEDEDEDDAEVLERKLSDDLDNEDSFIIAKKQYSLMLEKLTEEKYLDAYGKYFTARISTLTKLNNEFSQSVLNSFNKQYALIHNVFLKEKNYKTLNELLDKCVEEYSGTTAQFVLQEKEYSKQIQPALDTFVSSVNKLNEKFEHKALNMLDKEDRKKVEEIHEELEESEKDAQEQEKSQKEVSIADKKAKESIEKVVEKQKESAEKTPSSEEKSQQSETHFIEQIMRKDSQVKEETSSRSTEQNQNFYSAFRQSHTPSAGKVVDTSRSSHIDSPNIEGEVASASLKDRMSRLEKFKGTSPTSSQMASPRTQETEPNVSNVFSTLSREKERKNQQFDTRNRRNRAEIDEISHEEQMQDQMDAITQRQREEMIRQQQMFDDFYDFEK
jgi:hypothetical protein